MEPNPSPLLAGYPWNHKLDIFRSRSICESCRKSGTKFLKIFCTHIRRSDSKLLDFQVPRYLKSGLGRAGLGPWVGPWQCCAGARRRGPARPRPDLTYLGTWKSRSLESHGTLATKISEFWTYWNPGVKDFRILDLLEPLRQRFPDFQPPPAPEELSDPNLTPLPTHPGIKYFARALAATT